MKSHLEIMDRILKEIRSADSFCIVGHIRPDGDCIGSQVGMTYALKGLGKKVSCWNQDPVPSKLAFLNRKGWVRPPKEDKSFDCVIAVDCGSLERLGSVAEHIQKRKCLINIDHHESNTRYGDLNWVSPDEPATGELIFNMMKAAKWPIDKSIANCLYTAISTDTGSFQYATTKPSTFRVASELVESGADLATICDEVYQSFPLSRARLLKRVYTRFRLTDKNQIAYFWLKKSDLSRSGAGVSETEGLIDHIRSIEPVVVACLFEELEDDGIRISLRSNSNKVNVSEIAKQFGGGGHPALAGARISGNNQLSIQRKVLKAILKSIH